MRLGRRPGIHGWDCLWIGLGVFMDVMKWSQIAANRKGIPGYPKDQAYPGMPATPVQ